MPARRGDCGRDARGGRAPAGLVDGCRPQPSVVTIAGEPAAVVEAAVRGAGKAVELIDLTRQQGVHPRIGAADVIPFVPVSGHQAGAVRAAGPAGGPGDLAAVRRAGVFLRGGGGAAGPGQSGRRAAGPVRGAAGAVRKGSVAAARPGRAGTASDRRRLRRGRAQVPGGLQHLFRFVRT